MHETEFMMDILQRVWSSGYRAYEVANHRNPHKKGSLSHTAWQEGYRTAKYEYEEAPADE